MSGDKTEHNKSMKENKNNSMGKLYQLIEELNTISTSKRKELFINIATASPRYQNIMAFRGNVAANPNFQLTFNGFYQVRRNSAWRKNFYSIFATLRKHGTGKKQNLKYILNEIHSRTGRWEYSFSTKLLHTLDPNQPIIDKRVLMLLCLPKKNWKTMEPFIKHYEEVKLSIVYLAKNMKGLLRDFDRNLPTLKHISEIKKIDFILWRYNTLEKVSTLK